jgi:hypothetical protein
MIKVDERDESLLIKDQNVEVSDTTGAAIVIKKLVHKKFQETRNKEI